MRVDSPKTLGHLLSFRSKTGNLLGNLLCAVAGLLDGTGLLNQLRLANVLNRVLALWRV